MAGLVGGAKGRRKALSLEVMSTNDYRQSALVRTPTSATEPFGVTGPRTVTINR